jgi:hypothetical protein
LRRTATTPQHFVRIPIFKINLYNDLTVTDEGGREFASLSEAKEDAVRTGRGIMAEHVALGQPVNLTHRLEVVDEAGTVVEKVCFGDLVVIQAFRDDH